MVIVRALTIVALAGCQTVFSLDPVDRNSSLARSWVGNTLAGEPAPLQNEPLFASTEVTARLPDGSRFELSIDDEGRFVAPDLHGLYTLELVIDETRFDLQRSGDVALQWPSFGDPRRPVLGESTILDLAATAVPGRTAKVTSTGIWSNTFPKVISVTTYELDWLNALTPSGRPKALSAALGDVLYYSGTSMIVDELYYAITDINEVQLEMAPGSRSSIGAPEPITADLCAHLQGALLAEYDRVTDATPAFMDYRGDWTIHSIPSLELGPRATTSVAFELFEARPDFDIDTDVQFANPFRGSKLIASMGLARIRSVRFPGSTTTTIIAGTRHYVPVSAAADCGEPAILNGSIGLANRVVVGDTMLVDDDSATVTVESLSADVPASWSLDGPRGDFYLVTLVEVLGNAGTTVLRNVLTTYTFDEQVLLPASLLQANHYYTLIIDSEIGYPDAPAGDLAHAKFPASQSLIFSPVFKIGAR